MDNKDRTGAYVILIILIYNWTTSCVCVCARARNSNILTNKETKRPLFPPLSKE